ncbi:urease accessory protein UreD [Falsirhodobacter xinxiangensis]|uniref:urease accessory protein UreD n=1 Tax=Falsirhodobacter xinxiangensis TaxID=2530049 RepID=UPI0010AB0823|nr:urease accessory protein UreD [Rhodobacter xinxiangensis]
MNFPPSSLRRLERSRGEAHVRMKLQSGTTRLADLCQQGSAKAILPRGVGTPEVVFLNTSGGLTGGDRLDLSLALDDGCQAVATTQTAERAYDSGGSEAVVTIRHSVGQGGWLDWLPQETILYDGSSVTRSTEIALTGRAGCLLLEMVVLGRAAMGETVGRLAFTDRRSVLRDGVPVLTDPLSFGDEASAAVPGGARAFATLAMVGPGAEETLAVARGALDILGVEATASAFDGTLVVRMLSHDGWPLRRQVAKVLNAMRGRSLPRVWQI